MVKAVAIVAVSAAAGLCAVAAAAWASLGLGLLGRWDGIEAPWI